MKKLLLTLCLVSLVQSLFAASATVLVPANTMTNFTLLSAGTTPIKVYSVQANTTTTNSAFIQFVDTYTNQLLYTNAAYTNILSYVTNWINTWTNYYGATNSVTNRALIDVTNSVAASTNTWPVRYSASIGTNATILTDQLNGVFYNGLWVTNNSVGVVSVTITYQQ